MYISIEWTESAELCWEEDMCVQINLKNVLNIITYWNAKLLIEIYNFLHIFWWDTCGALFDLILDV